jgi:GWxTD domain-containing protein
MKKLFFFALMLGFAANAQKRPQKKESVGAVDKAPSVISVRVKTLSKDSASLKVFAELELSDVSKETSLLSAFLNQFRVGWYITTEYNSKERIGQGNVLLTDDAIREENRKIQLQFDVQKNKPAQSGVLFIEFVDNLSKKKFTTDAPLRFANQKLRDQYAVFIDDKVNYNNYVSTNQRFMISNPGMPSEPLFMIQYDHLFDQAQPPMSTTPRSVSKEMKINVVRQIQSNKLISFAEEGLYFVVRDTAKLESGIAIVGVDDRFPRLTNIDQVVKPLTYVSSSREMAKINEAENKKLALDSYLLQVMQGDQEKAKAFMRYFFVNVEEANRLFTTYKEGWKTDKGLIFSVLGPPSKIQRSRDREVWSYTQTVGSADMIFSFVKRPNQFSDSHYELVRYPEYQTLWYEKIDEWRKRM